VIRKFLFVAFLAAGAMLLSPGTSSAQRRGGSSGWGGYGGRGYGGSGWGGSGIGINLGGYGYSPYYHSGYGYSPYYHSGYGSSPYYYSEPSYYGTYSQPSYYYDPAYSATQPAVRTMPSAYATTEEQEDSARLANTATIRVHVPVNAELWFEDSKTAQTGADRAFVSPPLEPNRTFTYTLRAKWRDGNGRDMDETRQVRVQAGRTAMVDFMAARADSNLDVNPRRIEDRRDFDNNPRRDIDRRDVDPNPRRDTKDLPKPNPNPKP